MLQVTGKTVTLTLHVFGFKSGLASPCVFKRRTRSLWLTAHGGDFTLLGDGADLDWFEASIKEELEEKVRGILGPGVRKHEEQSIRILNIIIEWSTEGLWHKADQRHAEIFARGLGKQQSPGGRASSEGEPQRRRRPAGRTGAIT